MKKNHKPFYTIIYDINNNAFEPYDIMPYFINEYIFGSDPVVDNITLYAKWERYSPRVNFITNIDSYEIETIKIGFGDTVVVSEDPSY